MNGQWKKITAALLSLGILAGTVPSFATAQNATESVQGEGKEAATYSRVPYEDYLKEHADAILPSDSIVIEGVNYQSATAAVETVTLTDDLSGESKQGLRTGDDGMVIWSFSVATSGLYALSVDYYNESGSGNDMERALYLDGEIPYTDAGNLVFFRTWRDKGDKQYTEGGNEIRRSQEEVHVWSEVSLRATTGYHDDALLFYLEAGTHTLSLRSVREALTISAFTFRNSEEIATYAEVLASWTAMGAQPAKAQPLRIQGEEATLKSAATLYAVENRSSPLNDPYDMKHILLNCIGGTTWKYQGAWIEWDVTVPETGLYQLYILLVWVRPSKKASVLMPRWSAAVLPHCLTAS